jgi:hypothetical protein
MSGRAERTLGYRISDRDLRPPERVRVQEPKRGDGDLLGGAADLVIEQPVHMEVVLRSGLVVRVDEQFDGAAVVRLITALEAASC